MFLNKVRIGISALVLFVGSVSEAQNFKVVLDAGHGGKDFGAVRNNFVEKKIVLDVALKVGKLLEKSQGIDVIYTRKVDEFIELKERSNIANKAKGDIFVSIHANAVKNAPEAYGTETFIMGVSKNKSNLEVAKNENAVITLEQDYKTVYAGYDPSNPESIIGLTLIQEQYVLQSADLANKIQTKFDIDSKRKNRGVKQGPFWVLHGAFMPSVLVEVGFISNPDEGEYLNSEEGRNELARSIANAIIDYKNVYYSSAKTASIPAPKEEVKKIIETKVEPKVEPKTKAVETKVESKVKPVEVKPATVVADTAKVVSQSPVKTEASSANAENGTIFMIQIAASSKDIPTTPANFNGFDGVFMKKEDSLYKYYYFSTPDYQAAVSKLEEVKKKVSSAYIVAYKNGIKVSVKEALR